MLSAAIVLSVTFAVCMRCAFGYGPWLELTPLGGVELDDSGLARAELEQRLGKIERETADRPMGVTRAKSLAMLFDNVRLAVNTTGLFASALADDTSRGEVRGGVRWRIQVVLGRRVQLPARHKPHVPGLGIGRQPWLYGACGACTAAASDRAYRRREAFPRLRGGGVRGAFA